jgi:F-type H+-transporting ATPase subunit epsilon
METFAFDLVTPQATFFSGQANMVEAPGTLGDFGVLAGHMPFISTLRAGGITILDDKNNQSKLFVVGGIAEVNAKSCTILAEQVVDIGTFSRADAEGRLAKAKDAVDKAFDENAKTVAARELEVAEALLASL